MRRNATSSSPLRSTLGRATLLLGAAAALLPVGSARAQDAPVRIAFVDLNRVLKESAPARAAEAKMLVEFGKRRKELDDLERTYRAASEKFQRDAAALSEGDKIRRQRELIDMEQNLAVKSRSYRDDYAQRREDELGSISDRVGNIVKGIADKEKYDLVVKEAFVASARIDLTKRVLAELDKSSGK